MKSKELFDSFYEKELKNVIENFETKRKLIHEKYSFKRYRRNLKWMGFACLAIIIAGQAIPEKIPTQVIFFVPFTVGYSILAAIFIFVMRLRAFKPMKGEYKQTVIPKIISFVDTHLTYKPEEGLTREEFDRGRLFSRYSQYKSEDLVYGRVDNIEIRMSDISCTRNETSNNSKGSHQVTVFKGLYVISKLPGKMNSGVIVKPANLINEAIEGLARKLLGNQLVDSINNNLELNDTHTGNAEFDKLYVVKSVNPDVSKALLTPRIIQIILSFQKELNLPVSFSFFDNDVHIALSGVDLFEADVHTSFVEKDISKQYFAYLNLAVGIAEAIHVSQGNT